MNAAALDTETIWKTLATILDPEFGINVVDLGLIYSVELDESNIHVIMTLTTPTCPSGAWIQGGVDAALRQLPGVKDARVDLVFEPRWTPEMLSEAAREQLGWNGRAER